MYNDIIDRYFRMFFVVEEIFVGMAISNLRLCKT